MQEREIIPTEDNTTDDEPLTLGQILAQPPQEREADRQTQRSNAVLTAREALAGTGGLIAQADEVMKVADFIMGNHTPQLGFTEIIDDYGVLVDPQGFTRISIDQLRDLVKNSKKIGWYECYANRPLYYREDGSPKGPMQNPYDDIPANGYPDWSDPKTWGDARKFFEQSENEAAVQQNRRVPDVEEPTDE